MPTPPPLPNFAAFRGYVVKELYGSTAIPKILDWSEKMEEWAKTAVGQVGSNLKQIEQLEQEVDQLKKQVSSFEEELMLLHSYENVARLASDVKRGIRDLDELMEEVE